MKRILETNFYEFNQNNSGGYFDVNDNVCRRVVIEALDEAHAKLIFYPMIEDQSPSCQCCGDRWSSYSPDKIDLVKINKDGYHAKVYTAAPDYQDLWKWLYGDFKVVEEPKIVRQTWGNEFLGKVCFDNIEQYYQFLANTWGITSPDVIIHYLDGTKRQVFKVNPNPAKTQ